MSLPSGLKSAQQVGADKLSAFVKIRFAPYTPQRRAVFIAELPQTESGEIQRFTLHEQERG